MWSWRIILVIAFTKIFLQDSVECQVYEFIKMEETVTTSIVEEPPKLSICFRPNPSTIRNPMNTSSDVRPLLDLTIPQIFTKDLNESENGPEQFERIYGVPCKYGAYEISGNDATYLLEDGRIFLNLSKYNRPNAYMNNNNYCLAKDESVKNGTSTVIVGCYPPLPRDVPLGYTISLVISIPFLAATFFVYASLPELRNIHGKTLMTYVASLFWGDVGIVLVHFRAAGPSHYQEFCTFIAFVVLFSYLSSFFWLNIMCFDIWRTFGDFRPLHGSVKQRERKKFIVYGIYAWGCASIITSICLIMDFVPSIPDNYIKPKFGERSCWFSDEPSKAVYFYGPMGVTILCNIILFISTALKILQHTRDTAPQLGGNDSRRHGDNKQWFNLYLKLFIVMGINWSMEIISWLLLSNTPQWVWYITDITNILQGVIIFIIFVWKDKTKRLLMKRFGFRDFQSGNSTRSGNLSSTSYKTPSSIALHDRIPIDKNRVNPTISENDGV